MLSQNPNITFDNIRETINDPRFTWNWWGLSLNPNITSDNIKDTIDDSRFKWFKSKILCVNKIY